MATPVSNCGQNMEEKTSKNTTERHHSLAEVRTEAKAGDRKSESESVADTRDTVHVSKEITL